MAKESESFPPQTRILIVDDSASMRRSVTTALEELGFIDLIEASDGSIGWDIMRECQQDGQPIELVICDLTMENVGGLELLKRVRADKHYGEIPFIILTGHGELEEVIAAAKAKVNSYMIKPFKPATLSQKLKSVYESLQKKAA